MIFQLLDLPKFNRWSISLLKKSGSMVIELFVTQAYLQSCLKTAAAINVAWFLQIFVTLKNFPIKTFFHLAF